MIQLSYVMLHIILQSRNRFTIPCPISVEEYHCYANLDTQPLQINTTSIFLITFHIHSIEFTFDTYSVYPTT